MEEILHHLGCIKPCKSWDKLLINWCRISSINSMTSVLFSRFPEKCRRIRFWLKGLKVLQPSWSRAARFALGLFLGVWLSQWLTFKPFGDYICCRENEFIVRNGWVFVVDFIFLSLCLHLYWREDYLVDQHVCHLWLSFLSERAGEECLGSIFWITVVHQVLGESSQDLQVVQNHG